MTRGGSRLSRHHLRLASGLVLFGYVALHLANHALGLISLEFAERGLDAAIWLWHSPPGTLLLYGAASVHLWLAFEAIYMRPTLRMAPLDGLRIVLGLGIPTLLIGHAVSTRAAWELYHQSPHYQRVVWSLWATDGQGRQLALLVPGWAHGCLGIHLAFVRRPAYRRLRYLLATLALALPVLGGFGFLAMGHALAADVGLRAQLDAGLALAPQRAAALANLRDALLAGYAACIAAVFAARALRAARTRRPGAGSRPLTLDWSRRARAVEPATRSRSR